MTPTHAQDGPGAVQVVEPKTCGSSMVTFTSVTLGPYRVAVTPSGELARTSGKLTRKGGPRSWSG